MNEKLANVPRQWKNCEVTRFRDRAVWNLDRVEQSGIFYLNVQCPGKEIHLKLFGCSLTIDPERKNMADPATGSVLQKTVKALLCF